MNTKCYECRKRVSQTSARFAKDATITTTNHAAGMIKGERIYGPDCFEKLIASGAIKITDNGAVAA